MSNTDNIMNKMIKFQQGELDAVIMYKSLADKMNHDEDRKMLLSIAADEGKHARILKNITNTDLKAEAGLKKAVLFFYRIVGKKLLFKIISQSETNAYKSYEPYFNKFPQIKEIADDELRHGKLLSKI